MTHYDNLTLSDLGGLAEQVRELTGVAGCSLTFGDYGPDDEPRTAFRVTVTDVPTVAPRLEAFGFEVVRVEQDADRDVCICTFGGDVGR